MASNSVRIVVAAVIRDGQGRFLLARRLPSAHLGGLWEFPGGGVENGEHPEEALQRELWEELGVRVAVEEPVSFAWHRDEVKTVLLLFYRAAIREGSPRGREGQEVGWFTAGELRNLPVPPADRHLVQLLVEE